MKTQRRKQIVKILLMLESSMFNQDIKLLKKILLLWVNLSIKKEFVVTHEMTISVKNV
jgi:hypothetical protein